MCKASTFAQACDSGDIIACWNDYNHTTFLHLLMLILLARRGFPLAHLRTLTDASLLLLLLLFQSYSMKFSILIKLNQTPQNSREEFLKFHVRVIPFRVGRLLAHSLSHSKSIQAEFPLEFFSRLQKNNFFTLLVRNANHRVSGLVVIFAVLVMDFSWIKRASPLNRKTVQNR